MGRFIITMIMGILVVQSQAGAAVSPLKITPLGKPDAKAGGTFTWSLGAEPQSINPLSIQELVSQWTADYVMEGLLYLNPETLQYEPQLAENYEISKDGLTYTFYLRKGAKFSDGSPVTATDVKFSIDCVKDPAYKATARLPYYQDVESVTAIDTTTVKIKMKKKYYKNLEVLGTQGFTPIVSQKIYGDPAKKFGDNSMFGSGPYKVEAYNRGKNIILVRNPEWWGANVKELKGLAKFERVQLRFIKEQNLELEMMRKGQQDMMWDVRAENFEKKAVGEPFGTTIQKLQVENMRPKNYSFIGWNNRNPLFKDKNVRVALAHLLNRKLLIEKFLYGKSAEAVGPYYYGSPFTPSDLKPIEFNVEAAKNLLKKAGWTDKEKKGVLQKEIDGKVTEFRFTLLLPNREVEKYFTIYKEDLKKAGIEMDIKLLEWSAFERLLNEQKFDAVTLSWGGGSVEDDLTQIWHSESSKPGGSNFVGYSNSQVDKMIDQARGEINEGKRKVLWQKITRLIAEDAPYAFMFSPKYDLFLLNKKVGYDKPTFKYDKAYPYFYSAPQ